MAGRNVGKLLQRVCQRSTSRVVPTATTGAKVVGQRAAKSPAWLLAAAPFVWDPPNVPGPRDDDEYEYEDDDDDDDDEEEEEEEEENVGSLRGEMMKNWSDNAETHPQYRKTVREARKILATPPPPPPRFPEFPPGFCVDPDKVPPKPPTLPTLKFLEFHDDNRNNSKKLPSTCPQTRPQITDVAECPSQHMKLTPKMPDLPFCDRPLPPPPLPMPPPCDELGPPPPPPPDPPTMFAKIELPPPALPAPPPMSYELPPPPSVTEPLSYSKIPPLPCLPHKISGTAMVKCENENNNTLSETPSLPSLQARGDSLNNSATALPPPPPMLRGESLSPASYWRGDSPSKSVKKKKKKVKTAKRGEAEEEEANVVQNDKSAEQNRQSQVEDMPRAEPEAQEKGFQVSWSYGKKSRE